MVSDRDIINIMQAGLPLCPEPYAAVAARLGMAEKELLGRVNTMLETGKIRRVGLVPNHYRIGYRHNAMTVWAVDENKIDAVGELFGRQASVSHCYQRPSFPPAWPYNLFAMVHGRSLDEVNAKVDSLRELIGDDCTDSDVLFSEKILKKTGLRLKDRNTHA